MTKLKDYLGVFSFSSNLGEKRTNVFRTDTSTSLSFSYSYNSSIYSSDWPEVKLSLTLTFSNLARLIIKQNGPIVARNIKVSLFYRAQGFWVFIFVSTVLHFSEFLCLFSPHTA